MKRSLAILVPALVLALAATGPACKRSATDGARGPDKAAQKVVLPDPLPLPAKPKAGFWIADPGATAAAADAWLPAKLDARRELAGNLRFVTDEADGAKIGEFAALDQPWGAVQLREQQVLRFPVAGDAAAVKAWAQSHEAVGSFGAFRLAPAQLRLPGTPEETPPEEYLAWFDEDQNAIAIAKTEAGLVTTRKIGEHYGKNPVWFTAAGSELHVGVELPIERITLEGTIEDFEVRADLVEGSDPFAELPIGPGALSAALGDPQIAIGATTRWTGHEAAVKQLITQIDRQIDGMNFVVRGIARDMQARFNAMARSWDGRVMAAAGDGHLRIAYGSPDPKKSGVAVLRFVGSVKDNVDLFRMFTDELPKISLTKKKDESAEPIHVITLSRAAKFVPPELAGLIDDRGKLRIAMSWSPHVGGGMIVVGPEASSQMKTWLDAAAKGPSGKETASDLAAATLAIPPEQVLSLAPAAPSASGTPAQTGPGILELKSDGPRYTVDARRPDPVTVVVRVRGPKPTRAAAHARAATEEPA